MTDPDLDRKLARLRTTPAPRPSEGAEERAVRLATAAFEDAQAEKSRARAKGTGAGRRQTSASPSRAWRFVMHNRMAIGGAAACLIAAPIAAVLVAENNLRPSFRQEVHAPVGKPPAEAPVSAPVAQSEKKDAAPKPKAAPEPAKEADNRLDGLGAVGGYEAQQRKAEAQATQRSFAPPAPPPAAAPQSGGRVESFARAPSRDMIVAGVPEDRDRFVGKTANGVKVTASEPVSTFSIDADTASYSWVRRSLKEGRLPAPDQVRTEELVNYFPYDYPKPESADAPFRPTVAVYQTPWNAETKLVHIGIKGFDPAPAARPKANLVFLIDVSGSMNEPDKLPLVKSSLKLLLGKLAPDDHVAIVTYAGQAGVALEPTKASDKEAIKAAIDKLGAGGSTAGAAGIAEAYRLAKKNFDPKGVNRVLLATDGDFNVGVSDDDGLQRMIEGERKSGAFLSVLGFGQGNYNDALMQRLAQNGNGTAAYIDELDEAQKTLVEEAGSTLFPIAKDAKIQVEFNPAQVTEYRLVGYETRMLNREDFNDDKVDAGEVGSGSAVTALYEIVPVGSKARLTDDLRYAAPAVAPAKPSDSNGEYGYLKIRYKLPNEDKSRLIEQPIGKAQETDAAKASDDVRFASAVAAFGQKLRGDRRLDEMGWDQIATLAEGARGSDKWGYRAGFVRLVGLAKSLSKE